MEGGRLEWTEEPASSTGQNSSMQNTQLSQPQPSEQPENKEEHKDLASVQKDNIE